MAKSRKTTAPVTKIATANIEVVKNGLNKSTDAIARVSKTMETTVAALSKELAKMQEDMQKRADELLDMEVQAAAAHAEASAKYAESVDQAKSQLQELAEEFAKKSSEMESKYKEDERRYGVDLEVRRKQNAKALMIELALEFNSSVVSTDEYSRLQEEVANAARTKQEELKTQASQLTNKFKRDIEIAEKHLTLEHNAASAKLTADNEALNEKLEASREENKRLTKQLDDLREAMVRMQEANSKASIVQNLGSGK